MRRFFTCAMVVISGCATVPVVVASWPRAHPCLVEVQRATRHRAALYSRNGLNHSHDLTVATDGAPDAYRLAQRAEKKKSIWPMAFVAHLGVGIGLIATILSVGLKDRAGEIGGGLLLGLSAATETTGFSLIASARGDELEAIHRYNDWAEVHGCPQGL
jgi:hypothetical protein